MSQNKYEERKEKLIQYYKKYRCLPSYRELVELFNLKSKGSLHKYVEKFIEDGLVEKSENGQIIATTKLFGLRILGTIQAGFPIDTEEDIADTVSLDQFLIQRPEATYMLRVDGESMIDAGIIPGDLVLIDRSRNALPKDIVVAEVDGAWTLKYFIKKNGKIILRAANKKFNDIIPQESLRIAGVVTSVVRKY